MTRYLPNSPQGAPSFTDEQRRIGTLLGIRVFDSQKDLQQIQQAQSAALKLGIRSLDSQNDVRQIRDFLGAHSPTTINPEDHPTEPTPPHTPDPTDPGVSVDKPPDEEPVVEEDVDETSVDGPDYESLFADLQSQFSELGDRFTEQSTALQGLRDEAVTRETEYQNRLNEMMQQQAAAQQRFQEQALAQQRSFETAQRVSASNMARGGQQTAYRLGSSGVVRGGTAGFRRRSKPMMPMISAAGFSANPDARITANKGTLNV